MITPPPPDYPGSKGSFQFQSDVSSPTSYCLPPSSLIGHSGTIHTSAIIYFHQFHGRLPWGIRDSKDRVPVIHPPLRLKWIHSNTDSVVLCHSLPIYGFWWLRKKITEYKILQTMLSSPPSHVPPFEVQRFFQRKVCNLCLPERVPISRTAQRSSVVDYTKLILPDFHSENGEHIESPSLLTSHVPLWF